MVAQATQQSGGGKRSYRLPPIGYVRTSYRHPEETPAEAPLNPDERGLRVAVPGTASGRPGLARPQGGDDSRWLVPARQKRRQVRPAGRPPLPGAGRDAEAAIAGGRSLVKLSARNQLRGRVTAVKSGAIMAEVEVQIEPGQMVAAITDTSRDQLDIREGDEVTVVIKSTEVLIAK
jgi:molybdopterin-binding protein